MIKVDDTPEEGGNSSATPTPATVDTGKRDKIIGWAVVAAFLAFAAWMLLK